MSDNQSKDNQNKREPKRYRKSELLLCIALLLLIPVWIGLAPVWYEWYSDSRNGLILKSLYNLLDGRWLVNLPIVVVICYIFYKWWKRIFIDKDHRYYRPVLAIIGLAVLIIYGGKVVYALIVWTIDYRMLVVILIMISLLFMTIKGILGIKSFFSQKIKNIIFQCHNNKEEESKMKPSKGFSDDNNEKKSSSENLRTYADEIVKRALSTNLNNQSFAIGVTGEWGVGKSTFLNVMEEKIGNHAEVVKFNPWMCSTPEQVTHDFFASLRHQLSDKYSTLSRSIREYAKYVNSLSLTPHSTINIDLLIPVKHESLFERKNNLSEKFSRLPRPVVVIIDDIDRLERDEVFEVLRLIRNTADLSNMIYLVAYDKEYVTSVLDEKNIKDSSAYLEKIFQVEVHLPKVEDYLIWETLFKEIDEQNSIHERFSQTLFSHFNIDDKDIILSVLNNYRRAKRFARLYSLNTAYLKRYASGEVKWLDVFWLELLQTYDNKTYTILANNPDQLLFRDSVRDGKRFKLRNGILSPAREGEKNKFEGDPFWNKETPKILERIFGNYIVTIPQSVCFIENYDKYFVMGVSSYKLSIKEMNQLLEGESNPEEIVGGWLFDKKYPKNPNSIVFQFKQIDVNRLDEKKFRVYLQGLLAFCMMNSSMTIVRDMILALRDDHFIMGNKQKAHDIVMDWFANKLEDENYSLLIQSQLLQELYITKYYDIDLQMEEIHPFVISNEDVESLLVKIMEYHLRNHPNLNALDLLDETKELGHLFNNCSLLVTYEELTHQYEYKQVAFGTVIECFSKKEQKPTLDKYNEAYKKMFAREEPPVFNSLDEENEYYNNLEDTIYSKMNRYFGTTDHSLEEFKSKCFV